MNRQIAVSRPTLFALCAALLLLIFPTPAHALESRDQLNDECIVNGWQFGIARYDWNGAAEGYVLAAARPGYTTEVAGTPWHFTWKSSPGADGVVYTDGFTHTVLLNAKTSGEIGFDGAEGIKHVTICGGASGEGKGSLLALAGDNEIPEFGVLTLSLALAGAVVISFVVRKSP